MHRKFRLLRYPSGPLNWGCLLADYYFLEKGYSLGKCRGRFLLTTVGWSHGRKLADHSSHRLPYRQETPSTLLCFLGSHEHYQGDVAGKNVSLSMTWLIPRGPLWRQLPSSIRAQIPSMLLYPRCTIWPNGWRLDESDIKEVIVTDSIQQPEGRH